MAENVRLRYGFFIGEDDWEMVMTALKEGRIILTKDTQVMARGVIAGGRLKALLILSDVPELQIHQVIDAFQLDTSSGLFSRCLMDNQPLIEARREAVRTRVPEHVFQTQTHYVECSLCHRVYWKGTHWINMIHKIGKLNSV